MEFFVDGKPIDSDQAAELAAGLKTGRSEDPETGEYENDVIKRKGRTLLTDKSTRKLPAPTGGGIETYKPGQQLERIPEAHFKKRKGGEEKGDGKAEARARLARLTEDELVFLIDYRRLEDLEKEKYLKFFECIGDLRMADKFKLGIESKRRRFIAHRAENMRAKDCFRFTTEINMDKPVIPVKHNIQFVPNWKERGEGGLTLSSHILNLFLKAVTKLIIRRRAMIRLDSIKKALKKHKINSRKACKKWVHADWKAAKLANIF